MRSATVVLPVPGVAGEAHVQRRRLRVETERAACAIDREQCGDLANAILYRRETDQLAIQTVEQVEDTGFGTERMQVDLGRHLRRHGISKDRRRDVGRHCVLFSGVAQYRFPAGRRLA